MIREGFGRLRRGVAWLRPPPRIVDWSIFTAVLVATASGVLSFLGVRPTWAPVFWLHRAVGLTLVVLLAFKFLNVRHKLTNTDHWQPSTGLSILTGIVALGTVGTGIVWVFGYRPELPYIQFLSVHVAFALVLVVMMVVHQRTRFRAPRPVDFDRRRTTMQYSVMLVGAALAYRGQEAVNDVFETPGADRRVTGSAHEDGDGNGTFPVTSWVADDPAPIDTDGYQLTVRGAVSERREFDYHDLAPDTTEEALLDCTSGWYTVQEWGGLNVGELLESAGVEDDATHVRFVSVTGYRWSLPVEEAREAILATHVGGEQLSHGHGAPVRLVAPGRRGFQWVKWVERIDVRRRGDPAQWLVTLVSGL